MADIELVIKIPEVSYKATCNGCMLPPDVQNVVQGIRNGTPFPFENKGDKEWVSVLDGPPSKDGRYYVTRHDFVTQTDFTDILWYEKGVWWNRQATGDYAVIAWQLLPQPYKAESEVKDDNIC